MFKKNQRFIVLLLFLLESSINAKIIGPKLYKSVFENRSAVLLVFNKMQDEIIPNTKHFAFDVTTIHPFYEKFKIPVDTSLPAFKTPYVNSCIENHNFILLFKFWKLGISLVEDATWIVPINNEKYDDVAWTYGEGLINIMYITDEMQFHLGVFNKIYPFSYDNYFYYDSTKSTYNPFFRGNSNTDKKYIFLNTTNKFLNLTTIFDYKEFSLYSLNLNLNYSNFKYINILNNIINDLSTGINYYHKHKNLKPNCLLNSQIFYNRFNFEVGIELRKITHFEGAALGINLYMLNDIDIPIEKYSNDDFYITLSAHGSISNIEGYDVGYFLKADFHSIPYIDFISIGFSKNYYYNLVTIPFLNYAKMTLDWTILF